MIRWMMLSGEIRKVGFFLKQMEINRKERQWDIHVFEIIRLFILPF